MILTAILNAVLAVGVIVMVITPLVWAILTQHRGHPQQQPQTPRLRERTASTPVGRRRPVRPIQAN